MKIKRISEITALFLFIAFLLLLIFSHRQDLFTDRTINAYNTGWTYSYRNHEGEAVLPVELDVPKDTEVVLVNTLPDEVQADSAIVFRTRMQSVRVYVGERLIYQYPDQDLIGREVPSAWNFVRLSEADAGQQIRICISSAYTRFSGLISAVQYGEYNDLVTGIIADHIKIFRMSLLIGIMGIAVILISLISRRYNMYIWHRDMGMMLVIIALWLCGESSMPSGTVGLEAWHYFAMVSLLFCPVFLTAYLYARWKDIWGKITGTLFYISIIIAAGCLVSEVLGGPDLVELLPVMHGMIAITLTYALLLYVLASGRKEEICYRSELLCIVLIFLAGAAEMLQFYFTNKIIGIYIRLAILIYALNLFRISVVLLYRKVRENRELESRLRRSRAELMASQIKPHFIYNTLNSIRTLIRLDPEAAQQAVYDFSIYLRSNLNHVGGRELIPFSEELRHIRAYLDIEKIRFEERLNVVMDIQTSSFLVPPLSIQPLVENAVKHGICTRMRGGTVTIRSYEEKNGYVVEVEDDGKGFDVSGLNLEDDPDEDLRILDNTADSHIGLKNIRFRVHEITGGSMDIKSRPGEGTKVTVSFLKTKADTEEQVDKLS